MNKNLQLPEVDRDPGELLSPWLAVTLELGFTSLPKP